MYKLSISNVFQNRFIVNFFLLGIGLFLIYHDTLMAGFTLLPGDIGDGRLNHYFLEHSWLWIINTPGHENFWDAPFFYPIKNVMAYSDVLLGMSPIYWIFRLLGLSPEIAYLFLPGILAILNYICTYLFLSKSFFTDNFSSASGSFLFSFCAPRLFALCHIQLWPQFYTPIFLYCIVFFFRNQQTKNVKTHLAIICAAIFAALQFYAGFYLGWFLAFGFCIFIFAALIFQSTRRAIISLVINQYAWLIISFLIFVILIAPMAMHYISMLKITGSRPFDEIKLMIPSINMFLNIYSLLYKNFLDTTSPYHIEHYMGFGIFTLFISIYGLIVYAKNNRWILSIILCLILILFITGFHIGNFYIWQYVMKIFPGASAIRALTRVFFIIIIIFSIGYALAMQKNKSCVKILFLIILIIENSGPAFMKNSVTRYTNQSNHIAQYVKKYKIPFAYINIDELPMCVKNLDAMWGALYAGYPTFNGYSGNSPSQDYFHFSNTPFDQISNSNFLKTLPKPYLLILNDNDKLHTLIVNNNIDLINFVKPYKN